MSGLSIKNLSMRFDLPDGGAVQALHSVSVELRRGELMSVLGPSGCGKTTLLNIVAGFLSPTSGTVELNGRIVTGPNAERGMVFQQGALFEWMNVRENVGFGPRMKGVSSKNAKAKVDDLLDIVGLSEFKEKAVYELSGGMQQRVALARCLANDPDVILMDEPLGALDALTREKMQSLVLKLWKETGKTIIFDNALRRRGATLRRTVACNGPTSRAHTQRIQTTIRGPWCWRGFAEGKETSRI